MTKNKNSWQSRLPEPIKTSINGKWDLLLPEHRAKRPEWDIKNGGWEVERLDRMEAEINHDDVVYDIGAEEGDMSALISRFCDGNIVLFEPNPKVWANIAYIFYVNKLKNPLNCFVGFAGNETELYPPHNDIVDPTTMIDGFPKYAYMFELIGDHGFRNYAEERDRTPTIKLDDYLIAEYALAPTVLNIDVEGAEFEVLKGASEILEYIQPKVFVSVHPEFMFNYFNSYTSELVGYMQKFGYKFEILGFDHEYHFYFYTENHLI